MPASHIPGRRGRLFGRADDAAAVRELLLHGDERLTTLTGPPGTGKTSLAFEVGRGVADAFPDGVFHVGMELATRETDPAPLLCAALGLAEDAGIEPAQQLEAFLTARQALLLLDNCEHVRQPLALLVDRLLTTCSELRMLATSRVPLRIAGEATYALEPLAVPDVDSPVAIAELAANPSVALFVARARAARNSFQLTVDNAPAVASICAKLGGLPLALEMAAARVTALTVQELADGLASAGLEQRTVPGVARHETLQAALDWSYDLLSAREQQVFRRVGALSPGWTLEAAERIAEQIDGEAEDIPWVIAALVDQSLLIPADDHGTSRYRALVPVREYAMSRLAEAQESAATFGAHARYYCDLAQEINARGWGARSVEAGTLRALGREHDNFVAAAQWAVREGDARTAIRLTITLTPFWRICGHYHTALANLEPVVEIAGSARPAVRTQVLLTAASFSQLAGRGARAIELADEALATIRKESLEGEAIALGIMADVALDAGNYAEARNLYEAAIPMAERKNIRGVAAWGLGSLSLVAEAEGNREEAKRLLERALELLSSPRAPVWTRARTLARLGAVARQSGDLSSATALLCEAVEHLRALGGRPETINCIEELGRVAADRAQFAKAALLFGAAAGARESIGASLSEEANVKLAAELDAIHGRLGDRRFAAAWTRGHSLDLPEAIEIALADGDVGAEVPGGSPLAALTRREREVALLLAEGLTNGEVAERLVVSRATARTHVERILHKLGCRSRVQVATLVAEEHQPGDNETKPA